MKIFLLLFLISAFFNSVLPNVLGKHYTRVNEIVFDASKVEHNARLINLQFNDSQNIITLDNPELIEDDAPAIGVPEKYFELEYRKEIAPWQEGLKKGIVIKKILLLDNPKAWAGQLLFFGQEVQGNKEPLHISVNGYHFIRPASSICCPHARQYIDIEWLRWYFVELPVGALKKGENEILMWTESETPSWKICIAVEEEYARGSLTRTHHPNRSMKSIDGGETWSDSKLGLNNTEDGEYDIRFSLNRFVPTGEYISPVIDLTESSEVINKRISKLNSDITVDIDEPEGTNAKVMFRFGGSPLLKDKSWTEWKIVKPGEKVTEKLEDKRYFQWKAEMTTDDPLQSPVIKGLTINSTWVEASPNENSGIVGKVVHNGKVITPSYTYQYENLSNPELQKFRKKFKLDKIVEGAKSEFEIMMRLLHWAYRVPVKETPYSWNANDIAVLKKSSKGNPMYNQNMGEGNLPQWVLSIDDSEMPELQWDYKRRRRDAMCNFSNLALQAALMSMGYQARYININSEAVSGHEITEVWSNEFNKWIYIDATRDYYYFDLETGLPMNLLEIHNKLAEKIPQVETWQKPFAIGEEAENIKQIKIGIREGYNQYSVKEDGYKIIAEMGYFRIPLRNNFYSQPLPIPIAQGYTMWGWDGYLNHYDKKFPKRTEFQRQSNRFVDFYEPLNQSEVFLTETEEQGILKVEVNTHTPGFKNLLVKIDDGRWKECNDFSWNWELKAGINKIEVRTKTLHGILGPISSINVPFNP